MESQSSWHVPTVTRPARASLFLAPLLLVALSLPVGFAQTEDIEKRLKADYAGKVLTLRNFYSGNRLRYSSTGELIEGGQPGPWTLTGKVELRKMKLRPDRLEMEGNRLLVWYAWQSQRVLKGERIYIELEVKQDSLDENRLGEALRKVFLADEHELAEGVPSYWRAFLSSGKQLQGAAAVLGSGDKPEGEIYRIGGDVKAPACLYGCHGLCASQGACPEYSEEAREAKYSGSVVLGLVLGADGRIVAESIRIVKAAGMGLDEQAVKAVQQWRFKPAERLGKAVTVQFTVEISFYRT